MTLILDTMSATTKKKHVFASVLDDFVLPSMGQAIVRIVTGRGNNLHEVADASGRTFLVSMPTKFRKNVWIKRGDFVIVTPIEEGDKVQAEIATILYRDQIRYIKRENLWPAAFQDALVSKSPSPANLKSDGESVNSDDLSANQKHNLPSQKRPVFETAIPDDLLPPSDDDDYDSEDDFQVINPNRPPVEYESSEEEEEEDDDDNDNRQG